MSAIPPKADSSQRNWDVRFVPKADSCTAANDRRLEQQKLDYKRQLCIGTEHHVYRATRRDFFMRLPHLLALALIGGPYICNAQTPADDVAAQIRRQGYRCDQPVAAYRDLKRSKPDSECGSIPTWRPGLPNSKKNRNRCAQIPAFVETSSGVG
jgi:hypothetical protein